MGILFVFGALYNAYESHNKQVIPYALIFTIFYLAIISMVPHKENRFILPVVPYIIMMGSKLMVKLIKIEMINVIILLLIGSSAIIELITHISKAHCHLPFYQAVDSII